MFSFMGFTMIDPGSEGDSPPGKWTPVRGGEPYPSQGRVAIRQKE
jgi:hypothetical protein